MIKVRCCYLTHTGRIRRINEDGLLLNDVLIHEKDMKAPMCLQSERDQHLYVVADGMGGHRRGELATRVVLEFLMQAASHISNEISLRLAIEQAKNVLDVIVARDPSLMGLGTTLAGMLLGHNRTLMFNCGDCRVYRLHPGSGLERITRDHSIVQGLFESGQITEDEMRLHPEKNIVTASVRGDLLGAAPAMNIKQGEIIQGDRYLICSDGIWENFSVDKIERILSLPSMSDGAGRFFREVMENGADDNLSLILLELC